jgi:hypothetical protein
VLMPWIKEKTMKNGQDIFRENTLYFFLYCEENCCNWLMKEYSNIWNEYFKSMLCLVIGFRGDVEMLSFLTKEKECISKKHMHKVQYLLFRNLLSDFLIEVYEVL